MRTNFSGALSPLPPRQYAAPVLDQSRPAYRVLGKGCFLDDQYFFDGDIVYWDEEPNKDMEPLTPPAVEASKEFFDRVEEFGKAVSAAKGVKYIPLRRPFEEEREMASAEKRRVEIVKGDGGIPVMGARKRGRPKVERAESSGVEQRPIHDPSGRRAANAVHDA